MQVPHPPVCTVDKMQSIEHVDNVVAPISLSLTSCRAPSDILPHYVHSQGAAYEILSVFIFFSDYLAAPPNSFQSYLELSEEMIGSFGSSQWSD